MTCTEVRALNFNMQLREYKRENGEEVLVSIIGSGLKAKVKILVGPSQNTEMPLSRFQNVYQLTWR